MLAADFIFIILFALLLSSLMTRPMRWRHPARHDHLGHAFGFLFIILFLAMCVWVAWVPPRGPVAFGSAWLSVLVAGLVVSLLVLAVSASPIRSQGQDRFSQTRAKELNESRKAEAADAALTAFGIFFWLLTLIMLLAIAAGYLL